MGHSWLVRRSHSSHYQTPTVSYHLQVVQFELESTGVSVLRRLKQLEEENRKLKQLVADLSLDKVMLQDVLKKNVWSARICKAPDPMTRQFA